MENWLTLERYNFDLERISTESKQSVMTMGLEFKSVHELEKLLGMHLRWSKFKAILTKGVNFELEQMYEDL